MEHTPPRSLPPANGMLPIAQLLPKQRGRPPGSRDERDRVTAYLQDYAAEFRDQAALTSSISRAVNLFKAAHIPPERWDDYLNQAKQITREHTRNITKTIDDPSRVVAANNKMPYFFAVLEDLVGLKEQPNQAATGTP